MMYKYLCLRYTKLSVLSVIVKTHGNYRTGIIYTKLIFTFQLVPRWIAPNVLTFAGFILTVADFLLLTFYDYDYYAAATKYNTTSTEPLNGHTEVIPQSLWYLLAVFLFLAYTLGEI